MICTRPTRSGRAPALPPGSAGVFTPALTFLMMILSAAHGSTHAQSAAEIDAGRAKAQMCAVCHGPSGVSNAPDAPHLAGQPALYLATQLKAYRNGVRKHEVMAVIAKPLSDDDIAALVAWYSSIKIEAVLPGR
jgi:cytochrome c553